MEHLKKANVTGDVGTCEGVEQIGGNHPKRAQFVPLPVVFSLHLQDKTLGVAQVKQIKVET